MSFEESRRTGRAMSVRLIVVAALLAVLAGAVVAVAVTSVSAGAQDSRPTPRPTPSVEAVDPQLAAARAAAAGAAERLLPVANNAAGLASVDSIAALQRDVAGLDTASRAGSQADLDAAAAAVQASLAAFSTSAAEACEAQLAAGAGGAEWAAEATVPCSALRSALSAAGDVLAPLTELEAVGVPATV